MTKATPTPMAADDDKQGLARLAQFEDCASAIDGLLSPATFPDGFFPLNRHLS
jgi:hypothetical protein